MKRIIQLIFLALIAYNLFLASTYVRHNDINFFTDIARDFLLLQEVDEKKIVLIGPRSSAGGLFHGPAWLYLNYPAYVIGHGNPIVVGWGWIVLIVCFLGTSFYVAKKLFDQNTAYCYTLLLSLFFIFNANRLFNPFGGLFVMPLLFYSFIKYLETKKPKYLFFHSICLGLLVHFQMAVGVPFVLLSVLYITIFVIRKKKYLHVFAYSGLLLMLSNYILFDLRHQFLFLHGILRNASPSAGNPNITFLMLMQDRLKYFTDLSLVQAPANPSIMLFLSCIFFFFLYVQIKNKKYKHIYLSAIYFYVGYMLLTFSSRNILLTPQFIPVIPLIYLIFASFIKSKYSKVFLVVFALVYWFNIQNAMTYVKAAEAFTGKHPESWLFLSNFSKKLYSGPDKQFGYFVYSPDSFGYQPKYAAFYTQSLYPGRATYLEKKEATYVIAAPPPPDNPFMQSKWWVENELRIKKTPQHTQTFPNGYTIQRYVLDEKEVKVPPSPNIDVGLFFR